MHTDFIALSFSVEKKLTAFFLEVEKYNLSTIFTNYEITVTPKFRHFKRQHVLHHLDLNLSLINNFQPCFQMDGR